MRNQLNMKTNGWETQFDENIKTDGRGMGKWSRRSMGGVPVYDFDQIKDFIRQTIRQERQQLIDEVGNEVEKIYEQNYSHFTRDYQPVDAFRDDIITLLQVYKQK